MCVFPVSMRSLKPGVQGLLALKGFVGRFGGKMVHWTIFFFHLTPPSADFLLVYHSRAREPAYLRWLVTKKRNFKDFLSQKFPGARISSLACDKKIEILKIFYHKALCKAAYFRFGCDKIKAFFLFLMKNLSQVVAQF